MREQVRPGVGEDDSYKVIQLEAQDIERMRLKLTGMGVNVTEVCGSELFHLLKVYADGKFPADRIIGFLNQLADNDREDHERIKRQGLGHRGSNTVIISANEINRDFSGFFTLEGE